MSDTVEQRIIEIIAELAALDVSEVRPEATPQELGMDSVDLVESIFAIEESFDIHVPFNANEPNENDFDISSVAAIAAGVRRLIAEKA